MKISYQWLQDYIGFNESPERVGELLTKAGLEVEAVIPFETVPGGMRGLVIGEVLTCEKHPGADKLSKTTVDLGGGVVVPIVCGAPNVAAGQKVVVATVGCMVYPLSGEPFKINKAKIRGEVSEGMICAEDEIGLGTSHDGIIVLNTTLPNGTPAIQLFDVTSDDVFEIGLTPNRADAASHLGVARDLKAILRQPLKNHIKPFKADAGACPVKVEVANTEACPRYTGLVIKGIKVAESPSWLKNRLKAIGLSPINNVVDATNYILHGLGQPLHAFDLSKVSGNKIHVRPVEEGTTFITLDGVSRKLSVQDLMICNDKEPMCIAGVFGGKDSGVSETTTDIFLESAYFSPVWVRKSAQRHGLKTDSSFRFERGTDPNMPLEALQQAAILIKELAGGTISETIDTHPEAFPDFKIDTSYEKINKLIGKEISKERILEILTDLGIKLLNSNGDHIFLAVPPFKVDVQREADIVEEVLRIYGYDNIELSDRLSAAFLANFPEKDKDKLHKILGTLLSDNGFNEIMTNSLTKPAYAEALGIADTSVEILNKLSEDLAVMRQSMLFTGLEVAAYNINRRQRDLKLYEFGKVYFKSEGKYVEQNKLALYITGNSAQESWSGAAKSSDFYFLNSFVTRILEKINLKNLTKGEADAVVFGHGISLLHKKQVLVQFGQVSDKLQKLADIKQPVFYAEFDLDALVKLYSNKITFSELNKFPEVRRDLSLVLDKKITFDQIRELALRQEKKLITDMNVFDVYEGKNLGEGKKAYAVSFILQDLEKTLTDTIIEATMIKLMEAFEKELGAVIRK